MNSVTPPPERTALPSVSTVEQSPGMPSEIDSVPRPSSMMLHSAARSSGAPSSATSLSRDECERVLQDLGELVALPQDARRDEEVLAILADSGGAGVDAARATLDRIGVEPSASLLRAVALKKQFTILELLFAATPGDFLDVKCDIVQMSLHCSEELQRLVDCRLPLADVRGAQGDTPAHSAAMRGQYESLRVVVDAGVDVNIRDRKGLTALHCLMGHDAPVPAGVVEHLVAHGADVSALDAKGRPAVTLAVQHNQVDALEVLLKAGADPSPTAEPSGATPIHDAAEQGHSATIRLLAKHGADVNAAAADGSTPLHLAVSSARTAAVGVLLELNADPLIAKKSGEKPMHLAMRFSFQKIIAILDPVVKRVLQERREARARERELAGP